MPPQWDILSTTSDTTITSDDEISISVVPSISIEEQLREARLQKDVQFKKRLEEKPDTYPPNTCVLMGDSILNGVIERNLSNYLTFKVRKFHEATVDDLPHHAQPK